MKRLILAAILVVALNYSALGVISSFIKSPQDDLKATGLCDRKGAYPELQPLLTEYSELLEVRIYPLCATTNPAAFFGPKLDQQPTDRARPLFGPSWISESGMTPGGVPDKRHVEFHAVGDVGYLEVHYGFDGVWVSACALYLRTDATFVPLKSTNDFAKRLEWDKAKFDTLKKWFDAHLPKLTELGVVEVSEARPSRVNLEADKTGIIKARVIHHPNVTNLWFEIEISKETTSTNASAQPVQFKSIDRPNQSVGFSVDGQFYKLTPKFVEPPK